MSQPSLSNNYRIRRNARGSLNTQPSVRDRELPRNVFNFGLSPSFSTAVYLRNNFKTQWDKSSILPEFYFTNWYSLLVLYLR